MLPAYAKTEESWFTMKKRRKKCETQGRGETPHTKLYYRYDKRREQQEWENTKEGSGWSC